MLLWSWCFTSETKTKLVHILMGIALNLQTVLLAGHFHDIEPTNLLTEVSGTPNPAIAQFQRSTQRHVLVINHLVY